MTLTLTLIYISIYIGLIATTFYILSYKRGKVKKKQLFTDDELPTVSVIIPAFNEEKSIAGTIESIRASDYPKGKLEIIIIDDGSKDKTLEIAKKYQSKIIKVYTRPNGGKGGALNYGIKYSNSEIILSMDADTFVKPHSVKELMRYFKDPEVMCVSPSMLVHNPKGILQRIQQAEYLFGLFLRKAFSSINAIHVTPGAFSAYKKSFIDKHGGYDEDNITEDLELALRIQSKGYMIENCSNAPVYTIAMSKFKPLMIQRRRWYVGLMRNTWNYKFMFGPKYGDLGVFVLPIAWISIFFSVFLINYMVIKALFKIQEELAFLISINFDFISLFGVSRYFFERLFFLVFTNPIIIFFLLFVVVLGVYMKFATKNIGKVKSFPGTILLYFLFFALLFGFWWTVSIIYVLLNKKVTWR